MSHFIKPNQIKSMIDCRTKHIRPLVLACSVLLLSLTSSMSHGQSMTQADLDNMLKPLRATIPYINIGIQNAPDQCPTVKRTFIAMRDLFECSIEKVKIYKSADSGYGQAECNEKVERVNSLEDELNGEISSKSTCKDYYTKVNELVEKAKVGGN